MTDDEKIRIIELIDEGLSQRQVAKKIGCSQATVSKVYRDFYGKDVRSMDVVIAGDKKNGTLTCTGPDHYVGTCAVSGGKMKKRHFNIKGSENAKKAFEEWKASLQPKPVDDISPVKFVDKPKKETNMANNNVSTEHIYILPDYVYVLAVGDPKIAGWFENESDAEKAMNAANKALAFAGVDIRYSVVVVEKQQN